MIEQSPRIYPSISFIIVAVIGVLYSQRWFLLGVIPFRVGSGILNTRTVEAHRQKMMAKLNVVNMTMLVSLSVTHKLVTTD